VDSNRPQAYTEFKRLRARQQPMDRVRRHRETQTTGDYHAVNSDHAAGGIGERPPGITRRETGRGLDEALRAQSHNWPGPMYNPGAESAREAERISHRDDEFADAETTGIARRGRVSRRRSVDAQYREIPAYIALFKARAECLAVPKFNGQIALARRTDNVRIRYGPGALSGLGHTIPEPLEFAPWRTCTVQRRSLSPVSPIVIPLFPPLSFQLR
jgi:hypothetical protein